MIAPEAVREAMQSLIGVEPTDDGIWVTTQCLYPSNTWVRVLVRGVHEKFVVSDQGGAVDDVISTGLDFSKADKRIRLIASKQGLKVENGIIYSPPVPFDNLTVAIMLVANVSKESAQWGIGHLKAGAKRDFREELLRLIENWKIKKGYKLNHDEYFLGASNKKYKFDHVIHLGKNKVVLIDPVMNESSSINAKFVAHFDVNQMKNADIAQRIVYDDKEEWDASNLNLLNIGATLAPFSSFASVLPRLIAH